MLRPADLSVLVTGAGGPAGVAVIRALRAAGHRVAAGDADPLAAGLRLADEAVVLPRYDDATYVDELGRVAEKTGATVLISTLAEEMPRLDAQHHALEQAGLASWLPAAATVEVCIDKWRFAQCLAARQVAAPVTALGTASGVPGPWVVKPRFGRGSRDVVFADHADEVAWALRRVPNPIVQTRLQGDEFTVDALVDRRGTLAGAVPRWRRETKAGISVKGETFCNPEVTAGVAAVVAAVGLTGPANIQGFVSSDGAVAFVEVNPRFSGGLPLSLAAGADLVGEYVRGVLGMPIRPERLRSRPGVRMVRYFEEIFEG